MENTIVPLCIAKSKPSTKPYKLKTAQLRRELKFINKSSETVNHENYKSFSTNISNKSASETATQHKLDGQPQHFNTALEKLQLGMAKSRKPRTSLALRQWKSWIKREQQTAQSSECTAISTNIRTYLVSQKTLMARRVGAR